MFDAALNPLNRILFNFAKSFISAYTDIRLAMTDANKVSNKQRGVLEIVPS